MTISRRTIYLFAVLVLARLSIAAITKINIATQAMGICAVANGCTGVATANASTVFGRSFLQGSGAPGFFTPSPWDFNYLPVPVSARVSFYSVTGTGSTEYGDATVASSGTGSSAVATSSLPSYDQRATNTTNNNVAASNGNLNYVVGRGINYFINTSQNSIGAQRRWFGLTDQTIATMGASDNPAGNYVGVHYCNDGANAGCATDNTDWFLCTKDATTINCVDSTVAADTAFHVWWIHEIAATSFTLYEYTGGAWVSRAVSSSNLPTSTTPLKEFQTVTCMTCTPTAQNYRWSGWQILVMNAPY